MNPMLNPTHLSEEDVDRYVDQRTVLRGISWEQFTALVQMRGECAGPRLAYLDGDLELMSPSEFHEGLKKTFARLLEAWADLVGVELEGRGSWTLRTAPNKKGGVEPDECYFVGPRGHKKVPDIAIEVVWTHGGLDRLEIYQRLGVGEIWMWEGGEIRVFILTRRGYEPRAKSQVLPQVSLDLFRRCLKEPTQTKAVKKLKAALRQRRFDA